MAERLLTLVDVADALGCSLATVKRRARAGALPVFRDGRVVRVRERDLRAYIARRVETSDHPPKGSSRQLVASAAPRPRPGRLWD